MKVLLKMTKQDSVLVPELKELQRILFLTCNCKSAAYELYQHLVASNWKYFRRWMLNAQRAPSSLLVSDQRKTLFAIVEKLLVIANTDQKKETFSKPTQIESTSLV